MRKMFSLTFEGNSKALKAVVAGKERTRISTHPFIDF